MRWPWVEMPADPQKQELRKLKRALKRAGSKHRRRDLKKQLARDPEGAAEAEPSFGKFSSDGLNGMDRDATRHRHDD